MINCIESCVDQLLLALYRITAVRRRIRLSQKIHSSAFPGFTDQKRPGLFRNIMRKVASKAIDSLRLPESQDAIDIAPRPRLRIVTGLSGYKVKSVVQLDSLVPIVHRWARAGNVVSRSFCGMPQAAVFGREPPVK